MIITSLIMLLFTMVSIHYILIREIVDNICKYLDLYSILNFHLAVKYPMSYRWNSLLDKKRNVCGICGSNEHINYCSSCKLLRCYDCYGYCYCTLCKLSYIPFKGKKVRYCELCRILAKIWYCDNCGLMYCDECVGDYNIENNSSGYKYVECSDCDQMMIKYRDSNINDIKPINKDKILII